MLRDLPMDIYGMDPFDQLGRHGSKVMQLFASLIRQISSGLIVH